MKRLLQGIFLLSLLAGICVPRGFGAPAEGTTSQTLELRGKLLLPPATVRPRRYVTVNLIAVGSPYYSRIFAQPDGRFRFTKLEPGTYTLLFLLPRVGQLSRTVEVTRSFADSKGRVEVQYEFTPEFLVLALRPEDRSTVSVRELKISTRARQEYNKAQARLREKDADRAIQHLERAIEESGEFQEAINSLGTIYFQRKQYTEAEGYFRRALSLDEDSFEPLVNLGGVLLVQGKGSQALEINQRAYDMVPQDALAAAQLGLSYYLAGDYGQAIRYLDQVKQLDPSHFTYPQMTLAQIFLRLGQPDDAVQEITEFLRLHPDSSDADRAHSLQRAAEAAMKRNAPEIPRDTEF
jgi:tetratricopeptide (TPR) repeat protein